MEIDVGEDGGIILRKVYSGICLDCENGEKMYICMRDDAFEIQFINEGPNYGEETGWMTASSKGVSKLGASPDVPLKGSE